MKKDLIFKSIFIVAIGSLIFSCGSKKEEVDQSQKEDQYALSQSDSEYIEFAQDFGESDDIIKAIYDQPAVGELSIQSYGPKGQTRGQVQIKINFPRAIVPLTTLSDQSRENILQYFALDPPVKGRFRFLGTNGVVFEPEHSLPMATHYTVMVKKGLRDIERYELSQNLSWEFQTPLPLIRLYPHQNADHIKIEQDIRITSNTALNIESLKKQIRFFKTESEKPVPYEFLESDKNPTDAEDIGMYRIQFIYILDPNRDLEKDTKYTVKIQPGVMTKRGNLPTQNIISTNFRTYPPFRFLNSGFCPHCGSKLTTVPYLEFSNQPEWESFEELAVIEPKPEQQTFQQWGCSEYGIGLNDYHLESNTTYTVTLDKQIMDIYGQSLENPQDIVISTGELTPTIWGPDGYQIITPNLEPKLGIKTVNINTVFYKIQQLNPDDILVRERLNSTHMINNLLKQIKTKQQKRTIKLNEERIGQSYFDLSPFLRGKQYGTVAYTFESPVVACHPDPIRFNGLILRTNIGIYTQFHPNGGIIKLNRLTDGLPISGAEVRIYREDDLPRLEKIWDMITNTQIRTIDPCFTGLTNEDGVIILTQDQIAQCTQRKIRNKILNELLPPEADPDDILFDQERYGFAEPPNLLIVTEKDNDWTFLQTEPYGNPSIWSFGLEEAWEAERPISKGIIFSDQSLYRPGDTIKMKGISRFLLYGKLFDGRGLEYTIKIRDPHGSSKELTKVKVSDFGTFHFDIPTKEGQSLGYYSVTAETPHKNLKFYGSFRLAEFRVPEFEVGIHIAERLVFPKKAMDIDWEGKYYFGAPMAEASSSLNITRRPAYFRPKGWDDFSFGIPGYLDERRATLSGSYLRETIQLDKEGKAGKSIKLQPDDVPYPMTYQCDVEVADVSRQTISANTAFTALPYHQFVGLKLSNWIAAKKDTIRASIIVTSAEGEAIPNVPVRIKLIQKEYHSVKTKRPDGRFQIEHTMAKKEVQSQKIKSQNKGAETILIPEKSGSYVVLAELEKKPDSGTSAARSVWIAGEDYVPWKEEGEDKLEIIMDKNEYQVGDEAVVFIQSPFPESELFINVCREEIFLSETKKIKGSGTTYKFKITEEMLPNSYVGVVLYRLGDPLVVVEEEKGKHMEKIGFAGFDVSLSNKILDVSIQPSGKTIRPAETVTVDIEVKRTNDTGHKSELTVMVVDEAVLSLTGYRPPDLVKWVYSQRGLSARLNDNRPFIITKEELLQKGMGYGGGLMEEAASPRIRKNFLKLAFYKPDLITDHEGKAQFSFELPDNLTTWRIMVVAVGENDHFGYGDVTIIASQPFVLRPILPRFIRLGDRFFSGVAITNLTEGPGVVKVQADLTGNSIVLTDQKRIQDSILLSKGESRAVVFPFHTEQVGETQLQFTASFNGTFNNQTISELDGIQIPLTVQDLTATETMVAVGETQEKALQQIKVDESIRLDTGGLDICLSSTALTNIGEGARYLVEYPYGCLEQTASKLLTLLQLKFLSEKYGFSLEAVKPVNKVIEANIKKVLLMQHTDGGFKFWPTSQESNCYLTPYVAYLFKQCEEYGYRIPKEKISNLIGFLDHILRNPCYEPHTWKSRAEFRINVLMGLHHLNRHDETYFEEYFSRRNQLSYGAQIQLATLLYQSANWKDEAIRLLEEIKNGMFITAQTAHLESPRDLPPSWLFMYSPIITTAEAIKLFLEIEPQSELIGKMARYLLNARKNGRWRNTYENSKAIDGLVEISLKREKTPPNYTARVLIAGNETVKQLFKGFQYQPHQTFIPVVDIPKGLQDIKLRKKGKGFLYYILSYSYRLKGGQVARKEGFSIKRTVKQSEINIPIVQYDERVQDLVHIKAGDVLDIELEFNVPQTGYHMVIDDPIPAGLEAIDASLKTTSTRYRSTSQRRRIRGRDTAVGYRSNPINHTELHDDRVVLIADAIRPGIYQYRYLLRATTSGTFFWPAAKISLMYEPEQFGSCSEGFIEVQ